MSWSTPKTNWQSDDTYNYTDLNKTCDNIAYLFEQAISKGLIEQFWGEAYIEACGVIKISGYDKYWDASDFSGVEEMVGILAEICSIDFTPVTFAVNGQFITYTELNRLETAIGDCYTFLS